jgi:hypothetical protein
MRAGPSLLLTRSVHRFRDAECSTEDQSLSHLPSHHRVLPTLPYLPSSALSCAVLSSPVLPCPFLPYPVPCCTILHSSTRQRSSHHLPVCTSYVDMTSPHQATNPTQSIDHSRFTSTIHRIAYFNARPFCYLLCLLLLLLLLSNRPLI